MRPESNYHKITISAFETPNFTETGITLDSMLLPDTDPNNWRRKLDKYCGTNYKRAVQNDELGLWEEQVITRLPYPNLQNPISAFGILADCGMNPDQYDFLTRVRALFPQGEGNCVINQQWLEDSMDNFSIPEKHISGVRGMGVDISSGLGRDFSTIAIRDGNKVIFLDEFQLSAPDLEQKIIELYQYYGCNFCNVERDGIGKPIYDHLAIQGMINVVPINSGGGVGVEEPMTYDEEARNKELKDLYNRKRDELWFNVRDLLNPHITENPILLPKNYKLKRHLMCATWKKGPTGKIQVCSKDDMRKKIKESPDMADAVLFAFADTGDYNNTELMDCSIFTYKNTSWS